jgi:hypothetical protein
MNHDEPRADLTETLLRLAVGCAAVGSDVVLRALTVTAERQGDSGDPAAVRARQALVGLLFGAYGVADRGLSNVGRSVSTAGRFWAALLRPLTRSRVMDPVRVPYEFLVERGSQELERWTAAGRAEEQRSRERLRQVTMVPVEAIVTYLRENPELEQLVRRQAESLLAQLGQDPQLSSLIQQQGDRYVEHLQENPESIQELIRGQSIGMAQEVANTVRRRTLRADDLLERFIRTVLVRTPREQLPDPPAEVRARATPSETSDG